MKRARDANLEAMEELDISGLEVILVAEDTAKQIYIIILICYTENPRNRLSGHIAIVRRGTGSLFRSQQTSMQKDICDVLYRTFAYRHYGIHIIPDIDIQVAWVQFCMEMTWI